MIHSNKIRDADVHFVIDPITRAIKSASATKTSVIQYDHNSERFTFMLPRYIEGHDMMESTKVEVHYINANAAASGVYIVEDLQTDETEENVLCSWLLSQNVTQNAGVLHFLLRFACIAEDGTVEYVWNTAIYKGISVASGMNNAEDIAEQYADILELWKRELYEHHIALEEKINEVSKGDFELIASGETTEEVNSIVITEDNDGKPIELCDMITIYSSCPQGTAAGNLTYVLNGALAHMISNAVVTSGKGYQRFVAIYSGKKWDAYGQNADGEAANGTMTSRDRQSAVDAPTVTSIKLSLSKTELVLPIGFQYEIYGRRVKNANS